LSEVPAAELALLVRGTVSAPSRAIRVLSAAIAAAAKAARPSATGTTTTAIRALL
jgi:hypothetical protein